MGVLAIWWCQTQILTFCMFCPLLYWAQRNNCLVVLHNFFGVGEGRLIFFSSLKSKSKLWGITASISPNEGASYQKSSLYNVRFKPVVLKCKQVDNNNLKNISIRSTFSKKKTLFWNFENKAQYTL